jgi:RND family efflux transporter MFP subunit
LLALGLLLPLAACKRNNVYAPPPPPTVTVSKPLVQPVTTYLELTGSLAAFQSVDLAARVQGFLQSIEFEDGSLVKKGQLLFVIEPEPYEEKLKLSEASVDQARAQLKGAQDEYDRQLRLIKQDATSQATVEKWRTNRDAAAAAVGEAIANAELARIDLAYTRVLAPFDGRIGRHLIDVGNLVGTPDTVTLATIDQVDPLYVYSTVSEHDALLIRTAMLERGIPLGSAKGAPVFVGLQTEAGYPHEAKLDFVDTGLDPTTGTIQVRAILPNPTRLLLPGAFVRLRIPLGQPKPSILVPDSVIGEDQVGSYVLIVDKDQVVQQRRIQTGALQNGLRVVAEGLSETDLVIVNGLQQATPTRKVTAVEKPLETAAEAKVLPGEGGNGQP